jgi:hypothetical protein
MLEENKGEISLRKNSTTDSDINTSDIIRGMDRMSGNNLGNNHEENKIQQDEDTEAEAGTESFELVDIDIPMPNQEHNSTPHIDSSFSISEVLKSGLFQIIFLKFS